VDLALDGPAILRCTYSTKRKRLLNFKQIVPRLIEQDDVVTYGGSEMDLS